MFLTNEFVAQGNRIHENVDSLGYRRRRGCRMVRAVPLFSDQLGLTGRADIVEFWPIPGDSDEVRPVDYKRGRKASWENDRVQLCAQAMCLEEMMGTTVRQGSIYHALTRRRTRIDITPGLRRITLGIISNVRDLLRTGEVPLPIYRARCHGCSLEPVCLPQQSGRVDKLTRYLHRVFQPRSEP